MSLKDVRLHRDEMKQVPDHLYPDRLGSPVAPCARPTYRSPALELRALGASLGPNVFQLLFKLRLGTCILALR